MSQHTIGTNLLDGAQEASAVLADAIETLNAMKRDLEKSSKCCPTCGVERED